MKKFLAVLLAAVTVACMFVACSKADDKNTTQSTTASVENATDKAKIKDSDAINFIKTSYTKKELGLDKVKEKYDFMISQNGVKIIQLQKTASKHFPSPLSANIISRLTAMRCL